MNKLKKEKGTWRLAPTLVTESNVWMQQMVGAVTKTTWDFHSERARNGFAPADVQKCLVHASWDKGWCDELVAMARHSLSDNTVLSSIFNPEEPIHSQRLEWYLDYFNQLFGRRAVSLVSAHCLPPLRYAHVSATAPCVQRAALDMLLQEWATTLQAESAMHGAPRELKAMNSMHWRHNTFTREFFLSHETDARKALPYSRTVTVRCLATA